MSDEWRVEVDLDDEQHGLKLGERLRGLDLDDEARKRLGDRVIVTRDGPRIFLYAAAEEQAREAERVARELVAAEGLSATVALTRWHPDEDAWKDASVPLPETEEQRAAEHQSHEEAAEREPRPRWAYSGRCGWTCRAGTTRSSSPRAWPTRGSTPDATGGTCWWGRRARSGPTGWPSESGREAPEGSTVQVVTAGAPHPVFVFLGAHTPGIARDLGL